MLLPPRPLRTTDLARAVGVHPNTIRLYENRGFLPTVARSASGYRLFTQTHLDQMRLAWVALHGGWPGRAIRESAVGLVKTAAAGDVGGALEMAHAHLALVQAERAQAEAAVFYMEKWAHGAPVEVAAPPMPIREAARLLNLSADILRNWEKNRLLTVPRNPKNGYRLYGASELGRARVIRMLARAGYSTMSILRLMYHLDDGPKSDLRQVLDTPRPDEEILTAADKWLSTLAENEQRARQMITLLEQRLERLS